MIKFFCDICNVEVSGLATSMNVVTFNEANEVENNKVRQFCQTHSDAVDQYVEDQKAALA